MLLSLLLGALVSLATAQRPCFPGFGPECCAAIQDAQAKPALLKALWGLESASGEAEAAAFAQCKSALSPCTVLLPNHTKAQASCCTADALAGWQAPGPAAAVDAVLAAAQSVHSNGSIWWVSINQTLSASTAPGIVREVIGHQYPNWYPLECNNATAIAGEQTMMCHGGSVIECLATVEKNATTTSPPGEVK
jgi:hypothetical protein